MMIDWSHPAVLILLAAIVPAAVAIVGIWRSRGIDEAAKQATTDSGQATWATLIQNDNRDLRKRVEVCTQEARDIRVRMDAIESGKRDLEHENEVLHEEIAELKEENKVLRERIGELERTNGKPTSGGDL